MNCIKVLKNKSSFINKYRTRRGNFCLSFDNDFTEYFSKEPNQQTTKYFEEEVKLNVKASLETIELNNSKDKRRTSKVLPIENQINLSSSKRVTMDKIKTKYHKNKLANFAQQKSSHPSLTRKICKPRRLSNKLSTKKRCSIICHDKLEKQNPIMFTKLNIYLDSNQHMCRHEPNKTFNATMGSKDSSLRVSMNKRAK